MRSDVTTLRSSLGVTEIAKLFQGTLTGRGVHFGEIEEDAFSSIDRKPAFSVVASCDKSMGSWAV